MIGSWQTRRRLSAAMVYAICLVAILIVSVIGGGLPQLDGPLMDMVLWARAEVLPTSPPSDRPVVVVALDQRSLDDPDLAVYPRAMFGPVWAELLHDVMASGAKAVGFDLLLAYSGNQLKDDFDATFLDALDRYGRRLVLARSATTLPALPYQAALGSADDSLGLVELIADADGAYRRVPAALALEDGGLMPSLAHTLLRRAGAGAMPHEVLLAPRWHLESIPTFSLVDVLRCAKTSPELLRTLFRDKIVFVGTTLAEEDRKRSPAPYLRPPDPGPALHECGLRRLGLSVPRARTVPGVYVHAAAVEAVVTDREIQLVPVAWSTIASAVMALLGVLLAMTLTPWPALAGLCGVALLYLMGTIGLLERQLWLPPGLPLMALLGSASAAYLARYLFEERRRREIQSAFAHYLAPSVVESLAEDPSALRLGGERREITVMFADLSGFTALSTRVQPEQLTAELNRNLGYIVEEVEATGGYVDKFLGDAVLAIWGAPVADPQHATHAVQAAQRIVARFSREQAKAAKAGQPQFGIKIGMNAGPAVVGNVGTMKRYNYTAIGETVNLASRLEGVPSVYACRIVLGPSLSAMVADTCLLRELDLIQVKGKDEPIAIYEPLAWKAVATDRHKQLIERYAKALDLYRAGRFAEAATAWDAAASLEASEGQESPDVGSMPQNPSTVMAARARSLAADPPPGPWTGVWILSKK